MKTLPLFWSITSPSVGMLLNDFFLDENIENFMDYNPESLGGHKPLV